MGTSAETGRATPFAEVSCGVKTEIIRYTPNSDSVAARDETGSISVIGRKSSNSPLIMIVGDTSARQAIAPRL
jgi:hypothetical protein